MKLIVVSICRNESKKIAQVLDNIPRKIEGISEIEKVVVDDGSTDDTVNIAKACGAHVIQNYSQKRLAYSFQVAVDYLLENQADIAVNIDGDMQFDPREIPMLIKPILEHRADFVAADRFTDPKTGKSRRVEGMPKSKYFGNIVGAYIVSKLTGKKFKDVTCGFRAYSRKALLHINYNNKFTYTQETFQVLATKNLNIINIPVSIRYFKGRKSRVVENIISYVFKSAWNILMAFRDYSPMKFFGALGLILVIPGLIGMIFVGIHFLNTGSFSPYKFVGALGLYVFSVGIMAWIVGIVADIQNRIVNNQEKILYYTKLNYYSRKREKKD